MKKLTNKLLLFIKLVMIASNASTLLSVAIAMVLQQLEKILWIIDMKVMIWGSSMIL